MEVLMSFLMHGSWTEQKGIWQVTHELPKLLNQITGFN